MSVYFLAMVLTILVYQGNFATMHAKTTFSRFDFANDFKCHLAANSEVTEALATEDNIPKLNAIFNESEIRS